MNTTIAVLSGAAISFFAGLILGWVARSMLHVFPRHHPTGERLWWERR